MKDIIMNMQNLVLKEKNKKRSTKETRKTARTRRQRGYHWEDTLVKRFNSSDSWKAFRLGSPSVALPDVLAVSTTENTIYTIEAKSGTINTLMVPFDQIERCMKWTETFDIYKKRQVILAFKFLSKKRIGKGKYENRELREFYKIWDPRITPINCVCTYDGKMYSLENRNRQELNLEDCKMPFKTRGISS